MGDGPEGGLVAGCNDWLMVDGSYICAWNICEVLMLLSLT